MTIQNGFFKSINGDRRYLAEFFTSYFASFIGNGVFPNPSTNLQVINNQNFSTIVRPGKGWINGHYLNNDDNIVINHQPPDGVLRRIDRIVFSVNLDSRSMDIYLKQGTPSTNAVAPTLIRNSTLYELALADIAFNPGATSISQSNITDQRMNRALCGIVHGVVEQLDTTTLFNQYQQFLIDKGVEFDQQLAVNQQTFDDWFAQLNDILDGDVAANLANMIITHTNNATPQKHIEVVNSIPQDLANKGLLLLIDDVDNPNNPPQVPTSAILSERIDKVDEIAEKNKDDLDSRSINVKYPPAPFVGVSLDGVSDDSDIINNLSANFNSLTFPDGRYITNKQMNFKHGQQLNMIGNVEFDGSNFSKVNGGAVVRVNNVGDNYSNLPNSTTDIRKGDRQIQFVANHNLKVGDIICLYDNTDFSWSSARSYYKKGEYARVSNIINATTVKFDSEIFDDYNISNSNFGIYKMNMGTFSINGNLKITNGLNDASSYCIYLSRIRDFQSSSNIHTVSVGCYAGICFEQSFNLNFLATAEQSGESGSNVDYGLAIVNCQHVNANGYFVSSRHAITNTGRDGIGSIVNRDCKYFGTVKSLGTSQVATCAFDAHGNSENIQFNGTAYGGINLSGKNMNIKGIVYSNIYGICLYSNDLKSFDHDISGCKFISYLNPNEYSRGVIDLGNNNVAEVDFSNGGLLNLNNIDVYAPNSRFGVVIRTRNTNIKPNQSVDVSLVGSRIIAGKGNVNDTVALRTEIASGAMPIRVVNANGCLYSSDRNIIDNNIQYIPATSI